MYDIVLKKSIETIIHGKGVVIALFHSKNLPFIQNPSPPFVQIFDILVGSRAIESFNITVPKEIFIDEQRIDAIYENIIMICARHTIDRGVFQINSHINIDLNTLNQPFLQSKDEESTYEAVLNTLDQLSRCFAPETLSIEGISVATGLPLTDIKRSLDTLCQGEEVISVEGSFCLHAQRTPVPWIENDNVQVQLGLSSRILRVMVGGPGDVTHEVNLIRKTLELWNINNAESEGHVLLFKHWSVSTYPVLNGRAQETINSQLVDRADILIALFAHRLGTQTGNFASGSLEEIELFRTSGRPVILYFGKKQVDQDMFGNTNFREQFDALQAYKSRVETEHFGLYGSFDSENDITTLVENHVTMLMRDLKRKDYEVMGAGLGARRAVSKNRADQVQKFRHTIEELGSEWGGERNSSRRSKGKGQFTLGKLASAFTGHRSKLMDDLSVPAKAVMDEFVTAAKTLQGMPGDYEHDGFWELGENLMESAKAWVKRLSETIN